MTTTIYTNDLTVPVTFIATLSARDNGFLHDGEYGWFHEAEFHKAEGELFDLDVRDWEPDPVEGYGPGERTAEVSANGRYVAFGAREELTGQPTDSYDQGLYPGFEVFRFDADTRSLACASCNPDGSTSPAAFLPASVGGPRIHYVVDDGRLFFEDTGPLGSRDVNGRIDVYEFEDAGTGTCQALGGCRSLISGGGGTGDSFLAAVSAEGIDVFFITHQQLVPEDRDGVPDLYDARVDGHRPGELVSACGTGGACHEPVAQPLAGQVGGSALFSGPGNLTVGAPGVEPVPQPKPKALTRAQKLARALRACREKLKRQRASCERSAHGRYGSRANVKKASGRSK